MRPKQGKVKSAYEPSGAGIRPALASCFCNKTRLGVFLLPPSPPGCDASPSQVYTHLYTWVEGRTVRVMCLAQEHRREHKPSVNRAPHDPAEEWPKKFTDKMVFLFNNLNKILLQTFDVSCALKLVFSSVKRCFPQINNSQASV